MLKERDNIENSDAVKSRSQVKREMIQLQKMGERLVELSLDQIKSIDMPDRLREAVLSAKKIRSHGARKRQLQFIGSLMRKVDFKPIKNALYEIDRGRSIEISDFHRIEKWRDDLVQGIDGPIEEILKLFPKVDKRKLWNLTMAARKELHEGGPPKSSRELFKYIKKLAENKAQ